MALSVRKDVIIDINDEIPGKADKNREWPNALPLEPQRLVISYLFDPNNILEEVKALDEKFGDETMAPFRNAVKTKIEPLLNTSLGNIYRKKPNKSNFLSLFNTLSPNTSEQLFDEVVKGINHRPVEEQIDFLLAVYEENWDRKETDNCFKQAKEKMRVISQNYHMSNSSKIMKNYVEEIIFERLNQFICNTILNSHQDSKAIKINSDYQQEEKSVVLVEQLLSQNQNVSRRNYLRSVIFLILYALMLGVGLWEVFSKDEKQMIIGWSLLGGATLSAVCVYICASFASNNDRQIHFLTTARDRFIQLRAENEINGISRTEAKSDNNLAEPLLSAEEQAEYKEDDEEESNPRPSSLL